MLDAGDVDESVVDDVFACEKGVAEESFGVVDVARDGARVGADRAAHEVENAVLWVAFDGVVERAFGVGAFGEACECLDDDESECFGFGGEFIEVSEDELVCLFLELMREDVAQSHGGAFVVRVGGEGLCEGLRHAVVWHGESFALCASFGFARRHPIGVGGERLRAKHGADFWEPVVGRLRREVA